MREEPTIAVRGAREHNLRDVDVDIPVGRLVAVTGPSGSGKSSLAFDVLVREAHYRFMSCLSGRARAAVGAVGRPDVDEVTGLPAAVAVGQGGLNRTSRSTVGTATGIWDALRLLWARCGVRRPGWDEPLPTRGPRMFSFNTPWGACPLCDGLGLEERVDPELLVADPTRTLRQGALVPTTPTGYIVYSQVTVDVLDTVCRAHGFSVDVPWAELDDEQRRVVLWGSDRVTVPFGKHPLESRLKWQGITARPREEGTYKGLLPTMEGILKRSRNKNVLRFVRSLPCSACGGSRLNETARSVVVGGIGIDSAAAMTLDALGSWASGLAGLSEAGEATRTELLARLAPLADLGLGHLTTGRGTTDLSEGEGRRMRVAAGLVGGPSGVLYVLDEPSSGLHATDGGRLLSTLGRLRDGGNTVLVVDHAPAAAAAAEDLVELGPGAAEEGGRLVYAGPASSAPGTAVALVEAAGRDVGRRDARGAAKLRVLGARERNLQDLDVAFPLGCLTAVTGVSGAGKTTLVDLILGRAMRQRLGRGSETPGRHRGLEGGEGIRGVVEVDQSPLGRTSRSNPATYTKLFDPIRKLFADEPLARERGWGPGRFSFNVEGGRCPVCEGSGLEEVGLAFLGSVAVRCRACAGLRFDDDTLSVRWRGHTVAGVLDLSAEAALPLFADVPAVERVLATMVAVGVGYLGLGQPSTTLSGGEAQRVKLAAELARPGRGRTLYLLDEPATGLHPGDTAHLTKALQGLVDGGNTVVVVDHTLQLAAAADWVIDLGPGAGPAGGRLVAEGTPEAVASGDGATGRALKLILEGRVPRPGSSPLPRRGEPSSDLILRGARTHNLQGVDVTLPRGKLTVVTGPSGSGKSSLAFDTLHAEAAARYGSHLSSHARRALERLPRPPLDEARNLPPSVAVDQSSPGRSPRSTVATATGMMDYLRFLWARAGRLPEGGPPTPLSARLFSFNVAAGACPACTGLGASRRCSGELLVTDPGKSLLAGAMDGTKAGRFYGAPGDRHVATLRAVGAELGFDYDLPWRELPDEARAVAMGGCGDRTFHVSWEYARGKRRGVHELTTTWLGFAGLVDEEYARVHGDDRGEALEPLMVDVPCSACDGERLAPLPRSVTVAGRRLGAFCRLEAGAVGGELRRMVEEIKREDGEKSGDRSAVAGATERLACEVEARAATLVELGLGYLTLDRRVETLSGGEAHRLRLAAALGLAPSGLLHVLDEPTCGLHPADTARLAVQLRRLCEAGGTAVVVEHDPAVVASADHVVELGPGGGARGGRVVYEGPPRATVVEPPRIEGERRSPTGWLRLRGASVHNLRALDVDLPTGVLTAITGVSGSGKSSLVEGVLVPSLREGTPRGCRAVEGLEGLGPVHVVERGGSAPSPAVTPASVVGLHAPLGRLFAATDEARARRFGPARFSPLSKAGRCPACAGLGRERVAMGVLADVWLPCPDCEGRRFEPETLGCLVDGRSVADVLALTVDEARDVLGGHRDCRRPLDGLAALGLGYLRLDQPESDLSGGERGRLHLASGLPDAGAGSPVLVLDEPTAGLGPGETGLLLGALTALVGGGATVVVVEHDLQVVAAADHVIDLGPGAGAEGGRLVAAGTPARVALCDASLTGRALRGHGGDAS